MPAFPSSLLRRLSAVPLRRKRQRWDTESLPTENGATSQSGSTEQQAGAQRRRSRFGPAGVVVTPAVARPVPQLPPHLRDIPNIEASVVRRPPTRVLVFMNVTSQEEMKNRKVFQDVVEDVLYEVERIQKPSKSSDKENGVEGGLGIGGTVLSWKAPRHTEAKRTPPRSEDDLLMQEEWRKREEDLRLGEADEGTLATFEGKTLVESITGEKFRPKRGPQPDVPGLGRIFVEMDSVHAAVRTAEELAGRSFNGRIVVTSFLDEDAYTAGDLWGWAPARSVPQEEKGSGRHGVTPKVTRQANGASPGAGAGDEDDSDDGMVVE